MTPMASFLFIISFIIIVFLILKNSKSIFNFNEFSGIFSDREKGGDITVISDNATNWKVDLFYINGKPIASKEIIFKDDRHQFSIGRLNTCDLYVPDTKKIVSGTHLIVSLNNGILVARDNNSTNGTIINSKKYSRFPLNDFENKDILLGLDSGYRIRFSRIFPEVSDDRTVRSNSNENKTKVV